MFSALFPVWFSPSTLVCPLDKPAVSWMLFPGAAAPQPDNIAIETAMANAIKDFTLQQHQLIISPDYIFIFSQSKAAADA